jgi:hypothetical protein
MNKEVEHAKQEASIQAERLGKSEDWEDGFLSGWIVKTNSDALIKAIKGNPKIYKHLIST